MHRNLTDALTQALQDRGINVPEGYREMLQRQVDATLGYRPRIGFLGKTGAGKSTLCNVLFGKDISPVSAVVAGTRAPQEAMLETERGSITLVDLPGVGESVGHDREYRDLYAELLPALDLVLWLIKADDRALAIDKEFYRNLVRPHMDQGKPLIFVITQVEKMEPMREWDYSLHRPSAAIQKNIDLKRTHVADVFGVPRRTVVAVSANEHYQLLELVESMIHELPNEKKITVLWRAKPDVVSDEAREEATRGFLDYLWQAAKIAIPMLIPEYGMLLTLGKKLLSIF